MGDKVAVMGGDGVQKLDLNCYKVHCYCVAI